MPVSRTGTLSRSSSMPRPPLLLISTEDEVRPAAPMSWIETMASVAISSRQASSSSFSMNGSPTCTVGRVWSGAPVYPFAPRLAPDIDARVAAARRARIEDPVDLGDADRHRVDQDVAVVG